MERGKKKVGGRSSVAHLFLFLPLGFPELTGFPPASVGGKGGFEVPFGFLFQEFVYALPCCSLSKFVLAALAASRAMPISKRMRD